MWPVQAWRGAEVVIPDMPPDDEDASDRQGREEPAESVRITLALSYSPTEARNSYEMLDWMIAKGKPSGSR